MNHSQQNLLELAQAAENRHDLDVAIEKLEEALDYGYSQKIVLELVRVFLKTKKEDRAYALIKEEPDLFSQTDVFNLYLKTLQANNFYIERLQLEHLLGQELSVEIKAVTQTEQEEIMRSFKVNKYLTSRDYQQLLKLNRENFIAFSQSLLINPAQNFALRLVLCEDLIKLGLTQKIQVYVLGQLEDFIPAQTALLEKNTIYQEVIAGIGDRMRKSPANLSQILSEANLIIGSLYPKIDKYLDEPDSFSSDIVGFIFAKNGGIHQELLEKIYRNILK
ncbi:hypothetical protein [Lactobacillus psittaci]|uniref:Tetratricopeptide repeat protein n=1 Tax=Lactobacillus psittaci DSM 15354 TaxID=1122152 RepID=A0A0R1S3J3_9LACO|nr:hypothetical protein [Lactobacillus psittaci]KRL63505.1 hypothetical protein FC23_GL000747 [Lactobacillus psittaci DSM 15354]